MRELDTKTAKKLVCVNAAQLLKALLLCMLLRRKDSPIPGTRGVLGFGLCGREDGLLFRRCTWRVQGASAPLR